MFNCICISDYDSAEIERVEMVKARKEHRCCECGDLILPGAIYENATGLWDKKWKTYKTCRPCSQIRKDFMECGFIYTTLWETLHDAYGWDDEDEDEDEDAEPFDWLG